MSAIVMDPAQPIPDAVSPRPGSAPGTPPTPPSPANTPTEPYITPSGKLVDPLATPSERTYCLIMHLSIISWNAIGPFSALVPLIMWLVKRDQSAFINDHGRETLNFHVSVNLYMLAAILFSTILLPLACIGWPLLIGTYLLGAVGCILGSVAAHRGEYFRYPACIRFL